MIRLVPEGADQRTVVGANLVDHLGDTDNIIVGAADEAYKRLPCILLQNAHPGELGCFLCKVAISRRPLCIQPSKVRSQVQVVLDEIKRIISLGTW